VITSSVVCYRAALHRRRSSASIAVAASGGCNQTPGSKDWCILSLNYRNMCSSSSDVVSAPTNKRLNRRSTSPASTSSESSSNRSSNSSSLLAVTSSPSNSSNSLKSIGLDKISLRSSTKNSLESISGRRVAASPVQSLESLQQCDDNDNFVSNNSSPRHSSSSSNSSRSSTSSTGGGTHFKCRKALGNRSRIIIITWSHFFCVYLDLTVLLFI
jgi:hypothetical protein